MTNTTPAPLSTEQLDKLEALAKVATPEPEKLTRYSIDCDGLPFADKDGVWVAYEDAAKSQECIELRERMAAAPASKAQAAPTKLTDERIFDLVVQHRCKGGSRVDLPTFSALGILALCRAIECESLAAPAVIDQPTAAGMPDIVREAVEAAFEDRAGWRVKIAAAVRALASKEAAPAEVPSQAAEPSLQEIMSRAAAARKPLNDAIDAINNSSRTQGESGGEE